MKGQSAVSMNPILQVPTSNPTCGLTAQILFSWTSLGQCFLTAERKSLPER
jgi:hypothetical protein